MGGYLCYLASAIRQAEFANAAKDFGIKGKKREPISSLMILTGFFNMRKVERFAQRVAPMAVFRSDGGGQCVGFRLEDKSCTFGVHNVL